jgi:hypothetical protein
MSCIIGSLIVEYDFCEAQTIPCEALPRSEVTATWFAEVCVALRYILFEKGTVDNCGCR